MVEVLVEQESIAEIRKTRDRDGGGRKDVCLLCNEVLRPVILTHREAGYIRAHWRKRIRRRTTAIHVAKIQGVCPRKVMIQTQAELIIVRAQGLGGGESVCSDVWQREKRQQIRRNRINRRENRHLVVRHVHTKKRELPIRVRRVRLCISADPADESVCGNRSAELTKVALPLSCRRHGCRHSLTLPVAKALVVSKEESLVL